MTELDREIQAAIDALVHRLKNRDDTDDEPLAMEFVQAMIGRGWRPTKARRSKPWTTDKAEGDSSQPQPDRPGGAEYLEHRRLVDEMAARAAAQRREGAA